MWELLGHVLADQSTQPSTDYQAISGIVKFLDFNLLPPFIFVPLYELIIEGVMVLGKCHWDSELRRWLIMILEHMFFVNGCDVC